MRPSEPTSLDRAPVAHIYMVFLVSGTALTLFQSGWTRMLPAIFGTSAFAGSWVGCAILIGLTSGVIYASRKNGAVIRPVRMIGLLQIGAAASAFVALLLLAGLEGIYSSLLGGFHGATASSLVGAILVGAVVFVPNFLLGVGLALGLGLLSEGCQGCGNRAGPIGVFLLGTSAGTIASGYALMPDLGAYGTAAAAAFGLGATGCATLFVRLRPPWSARAGIELTVEPDLERGQSAADRIQASGSRPTLGSAPSLRVLFTVLVFSLAVCAITWMRIADQVVGTGVYARAAVTGTCLAAVGLGALMSARSAGGAGGGVHLAGLATGLSALFWIGLLRFADDIVLLFPRLVRGGPPGWPGLVSAYFGVGLAVMFLPCLIAGATVPLAWRVLAPREKTQFPGSSSLMLVALLGWLAACLAGLNLPSLQVGLRAAVLASAWLAVVCCLVLAVHGARRGTRGFVLAAVVVAAAVILSLKASGWNQRIMTGGLHNDPATLGGIKDLRSAVESADVVLYEETRDHVTAILRSPDGLSLKVNGTEIAASASDLPSQVLAAQVPLILARDPKNVLVLGLASGVTVGSALSHQIDRLECADANPSALASARRFAAYNRNALRDSRLEVIPCDPANYLLLTRNRYDVVISQEIIRGKDVVRMARAKLSAAGIFCQVAETDKIGVRGLKALARDFAYHFQYVSLWWAGGDRLLLVAGMAPLKLPSDSLLSRLTTRRITDDLARVGTADDVGMLSFYMMDREALTDWAGSVPADSRASSILVYDAPTRPRESDIARVFAALDAGHVSPTQLVADLDTELPEFMVMRDRLDRCLNARTLYFKSLSAAADRDLRGVAGYLESAAGNCPENGVFRLGLSDFYISYSRALMQGNRFSDAVNVARRAVEVNSDSYRALYNLASLEAGRSPSVARGLLRKTIEIDPDFLPAYLLLAELEITSGEIEAARETLGQVLSMEPLDLRAHHLRALCFIQRDLLEDARSDLDFVIRSEPDNTAALSALAYTWLLEEDLSKAQAYYRRALETDPENIEVLNNLATVLAERRQYSSAIDTWEKALRLDPGNQNIKDNLREARQKMGEPQ